MKIRVNSYHGGKRTHRSAAEEWQPHRPQGDRSAEWWNLTAALCDPGGARYFLSWSVTHPGQRHLGQLPPGVAAQMKPGQGLYACQFALISYQASLRKAGVPAVFVMNDHEVWDEEVSALCLRDSQHEHRVRLVLRRRADGPGRELAGAGGRPEDSGRFPGHVGRRPGCRGGPRPGGRPAAATASGIRCRTCGSRGSVTYTDERGKLTAVDVSGSGWADRQWED